MEQYKGKSIFQRIAVGRIWFYAKEEQVVKRHRIEDAAAEWKRYEAAREKAGEELGVLYEKALQEVGEINAAIFEVQTMMLEDDDYNDAVKNIIEGQQVNAEYAVAVTGDNFAKMFSEMEDEYFRARAADIRDISERLITALMDGTRDNSMGGEPVIVAAKDLAPSETVQMDKSKLLGFVTEYGSSNSHTAILARTMNIPALIGIPVKRRCGTENWPLWTDTAERFYIDPDEETLAAMEKKLKEDMERERRRQELKGKETVTADGRKINLFANVGSTADVAVASRGRRRGDRPVPERIPVSSERRLPQRRGTVPELQAGGRDHGREEGRDPDA